MLLLVLYIDFSDDEMESNFHDYLKKKSSFLFDFWMNNFFVFSSHHLSTFYADDTRMQYLVYTQLEQV